MIQAIRTSKLSKIISAYLSIQLIIMVVQPTQLFALTSGPSQPEFNSFTPIGTSDMVNLSTGDFNYNIPVMDVGGYPLNLSYDSGITMDQEASWVGLGWNLNVGQINRQVRGIPDDFKGDEMEYEKNLKDHVTVGVDVKVDPGSFGLESSDFVKTSTASTSIGLGVNYSNYHGISFKPSYGLSFNLSDNVSVGMNVQTSTTEGATISPNLSAKSNYKVVEGLALNGKLKAGITFNSSRGLQSLNLSTSISAIHNSTNKKNITSVRKSSLFGATGTLSFSNITMTPRKRTAFQDINTTFSFSTGPDLWGFDVEGEVSATGSVQKLIDKKKTEKAYGYEFTGQATKHDVLDYNRDNDRTISKSTMSLPSTNYTYDLYSVNGQGINGMFRPHRSRIGKIYDEYVHDEGLGLSLGGEVEGGSGWHVGANFVLAPSESYTGAWKTKASSSFKNENENSISSELDYEPVYFKYVGENRVDNEGDLFNDQLKGDHAMSVKIGGNIKGFDKYADTQFRVKRNQTGTNIPKYSDEAFTGEFKRINRDIRNQSIQKINKKELIDFYTSQAYYEDRINVHALDHHTAEIRILKPDGATYVFGETAYNIEKNEVAFTTDSKNFDCASGIVTYNPNENSTSNTSGIDHFYDKVKTPAYAHTYLLSAVLSSDYEDLTGNGPTDDDLGSYTIFEYVKEAEPYKWRVPYGAMKASYNAGLNAHKGDQKGSYIYGEKEIKYIRKIHTKTHIAIFDISPRKDARGVNDENGGQPQSGQETYKLNSIRLYSKPEYLAYEAEMEDSDPSNDPSPLQLSPIKTAYFVYDYSLCKNVDNNFGGITDANELSNDLGKLSLRKVYFTYRNSNMGKFTPYSFDYEKDFDADGDIDNNPDYNLKGYDIWGNYKPNTGGCNASDPITASEYPFVEQEDKDIQDQYAAAWSLTSIGLPSGGSIQLTFETDDYQYVQDKHAMGMFKVVGAGSISSPTPTDPNNNQKLYKGSEGEAKYLYIKLPNETTTLTTTAFQQKYLKDQQGKPIYFRFLMNMTKKGALGLSDTDFDYVTGYFELDPLISPETFLSNGDVYASIPMKFIDKEGIVLGKNEVNPIYNPISKAGWYFGRTYLNGIVYGLEQDYRSENAATIAKKLLSSIGAIGAIFKGPNDRLRSNAHLCAQRFIPEKSWIRLSIPKPYKLGGGVRVKQLLMEDNWNNMETGGKMQSYGQTYTYTLEDGSSSGVATFEPNDSSENPFVEPFYHKGDRYVAPREVSYVEKPFGKAFFPHSKVTYSKVTVKNIAQTNILRHATGKVVSEFYTSKDFPTKVDFTDIDSYYDTNQNNVLKQLIGGAFGLPVEVKNEFTLSQGFVVHTNDMDGKLKSQKVYQEGNDITISSVEYKYSTAVDEVNTLNNKLPVIKKNGNVSYDKQIGVDYDVITDFRESYSKSETEGVNANVVAIFIPPFFILIVPTIFTSHTKHENIAHRAITTKVVHTTAILKEKIATDLGSRVSTSNEAWDAETGQVILTKTVNEYDDAYYNFSFPAYWAYDQMGQASKNLGIKGVLTYTQDYFTLPFADQYLTLGDEIMAYYSGEPERLWVVDISEDGNGVLLMDVYGNVVNRSGFTIHEDIGFKIIRSGYRNQQLGNMGAITMMNNPIKNEAITIDTNTFKQEESTLITSSPKIVNASAVEYEEFWNCQCENELESLPFTNPTSTEVAIIPIEEYPFNPYVFNVKGEWRAKKSYAYLTERTSIKQGTSTKEHTRKEGYFKEFIPFYEFETDHWKLHSNALNQWTFASEVTQYSPFGAEIENRDALDRYSSAQYGYNFTLPTAVTSNSNYRYMGADNFEDYDYLNTDESHFSYKEIEEADGNEGITISSKHAHTGNTSLLVPVNNEAGLTKELLGELPEDKDSDDDGWNDLVDNCPNTSNPYQLDYDGDGIGDKCDDNAVPTITDIQYTGQLVWWLKQTTFTVEGKPNDVVRAKISTIKPGKLGWRASLNGGEIFYTQTKDFEIALDATGRREVTLEMGVLKKKRRKDRYKYNDTSIQLVLLNKKNDNPVFSSPKIILEVQGFRTPRSGIDPGATELFTTIIH